MTIFGRAAAGGGAAAAASMLVTRPPARPADPSARSAGPRPGNCGLKRYCQPELPTAGAAEYGAHCDEDRRRGRTRGRSRCPRSAASSVVMSRTTKQEGFGCHEQGAGAAPLSRAPEERCWEGQQAPGALPLYEGRIPERGARAQTPEPGWGQRTVTNCADRL